MINSEASNQKMEIFAKQRLMIDFLSVIFKTGFYPNSAVKSGRNKRKKVFFSNFEIFRKKVQFFLILKIHFSQIDDNVGFVEVNLLKNHVFSKKISSLESECSFRYFFAK